MKRKALIIDDDLDILMLLKCYFTNQGYEIKTVNRVGSFDEIFKGYIPNVVILDVWLSGADGRAVCRAVRENKNLEKIPVIMISAHALYAGLCIRYINKINGFSRFNRVFTNSLYLFLIQGWNSVYGFHNL